jgi:hypothetical protein
VHHCRRIGHLEPARDQSAGAPTVCVQSLALGSSSADCWRPTAVSSLAAGGSLVDLTEAVPRGETAVVGNSLHRSHRTHDHIAVVHSLRGVLAVGSLIAFSAFS